MSKIMHLIHRVTPAIGSKRSSSKGSSVRDEAAAHHQSTVEFATSDGGDHPPPHGGNNHHRHGRKRDRSLSLTEEKALRTEVREAAEERERQKHDAERKKAYDEVRSSPFYCDLICSHPLRSGSSEGVLRRQTIHKPEIRYAALLNREAKTVCELLTDHVIERKSERIARLSHEDAGRRIVFKARVHHARAMSKHILFLVFRQNIGTIQGVLVEGETASQNMLLWAESIHNESVVWVEGVLQIPQNDQREVHSSSVRDVEVKIEKVNSMLRVASTRNSPSISYTSCLPRPPCYRFRLRIFHILSLNWRNQGPIT